MRPPVVFQDKPEGHGYAAVVPQEVCIGQPPAGGRRRWRWLAVAAAGSSGAAVLAAGVLTGPAQCPGGSEGAPGKTTVGLAAKLPARQREALSQWLAAADEASRDVDRAPGKERTRRAAANEAFEAIQEAMEGHSPEEARVVVKKAIDRSVERALAKRPSVVKALVERQVDYTKDVINLNFPKPTLPPPPTIAPPKTAATKAREARCVFGVLLLANAFAQASVNIVSSKATCEKLPGHISAPATRIRKRVCRVNLTALFRNGMAMSGGLAAAANACTPVFNQRAVCAALVFRFATWASGISGALLLARATCKKAGSGISVKGLKGIDKLKPSDLGNPAAIDAALGIDGGASTGSGGATASGGRRLFLGGGKAAMSTLCALDITGGDFNLAGMALSINSLAQVPWRDPGTCQNLDPNTPEELDRELRTPKEDPAKEAFCAFDITAVLTQLGIAISALMLTDVHCNNNFNLPVLCAASINALVTSVASIANIATGFHTSCRFNIVRLPYYPRLKDYLTTPTPTNTTTAVPDGGAEASTRLRRLRHGSLDEGGGASGTEAGPGGEGDEPNWEREAARLEQERDGLLRALGPDAPEELRPPLVDMHEEPEEDDNVDLDEVVQLLAPEVAAEVNEVQPELSTGGSRWPTLRWPSFFRRCT